MLVKKEREEKGTCISGNVLPHLIVDQPGDLTYSRDIGDLVESAYEDGAVAIFVDDNLVHHLIMSQILVSFGRNHARSTLFLT